MGGGRVESGWGEDGKSEGEHISVMGWRCRGWGESEASGGASG